MTTLNIDNAIEQIKTATDKETLEKITNEVMELISNRLYISGKNKGLQINDKRFSEDRKKLFIDKINEIKNIPDDLKSEYEGHLNHHAVTIAYKFNRHKSNSEERIENQNTPIQESEERIENQNTPIQESEKKPKTPKKAVTLDAQKLIDLAVSWLYSDSPYVIGLGVALLTGRRQSEIYFYSSFKADDENTMLVQYLSKKRENYNSQFRIPVLCNSDLIENSVEKIRKLLPMQELMEVVNNSKDIGKGLQTARDKFNNNYSSQIVKIYNDTARKYLQDCVDTENKNDKDYFHGIRATYASILYYLIQEKYKCSVNDSINYVKHCLSHDTDGIAQKYTEFRFENLPSVNSFDDSFFSTENICEVPLEFKEDKKVELNFTKLIQKIDIASQQKLAMLLEHNDGDLETTLATFISKATQSMMLAAAVGNGDDVRSDARNKIANIVLAMMQYNALQKDEEKPNFIYISSSSVGSLANAIFGKNIDPKTLRETIANLSNQIEKSYEELNILQHIKTRTVNGIEEYTNLHLRGDRMREVIQKITSIYESM